MPELEKRKKVLKKLRQKAEPLDHEGLREHEERYMDEMHADIEASREQVDKVDNMLLILTLTLTLTLTPTLTPTLTSIGTGKSRQ